MRRNFFYFAMTLLMGLLAACSQEEASGTPDVANKRIQINAQLPQEAMSTRALPLANGHDLRCILEIWSKGNQPELIYRNEKLDLDATVDGKLSFEFALDPGDYQFLMWADFVAVGAEKANGHYTDKFYDTNDLKNITLKDASLLYNTDACDAFFVAKDFTKTEETESFDAVLVRPFGKLVVSDKNKENFAKCAKVTVSHKVPAGFNAATGEASLTLTDAILTEAAPLGAGNTDLKLFSYYVFTNATADDALGQIQLTFKDADNKELRSTAIPAGVSVVRNRHTLAKGYLIAEATNNGKVDVEFGDGWESDTETDVTPENPTPTMNIGDYYYADGTWSTAIDSEKECIGVVYAVDANYGEKANEYAGEHTRIKGYVMALESTNRLVFCNQGMWEAINLAGLELANGGYKNTKTLLEDSRYTNYSSEYPVVDDFIKFKTATVAPAKSSGWYIPSFEQLKDVTSSYFGEGENAKKDKFVTAVDAIDANAFVNSTTSGRFLMSSSITNSSLFPVLITGSSLNSNQKAQLIFNADHSKPGIQGQIRPILTVFE